MSLLAAVLILASGGPPASEHVAEIEINIFGDANPRAAIIFREASGRIIDWRWWDEEKHPRPAGRGRHIAVWLDGKRIVTVIADRMIVTRTMHDVELRERDRWPEHKRRKLR